MKIGILGYGKEGKSIEKYFQKQNAEIVIFDDFTFDDIKNRDFSEFDLAFRSPSVHPHAGWTSATAYFFEHCPCPIIGVTGTKGKGTTSSIITALLQNLGKQVYLVGNIGNPAIDILDELTPDNIVVYEMSSFQLWDLEKSPHVAVITIIEPDHLNVHDNYDDYVNAKANIAKHQTPDDYLIYHLDNPDITKIAKQSPSRHIAYPGDKVTGIDKLTSHLAIPGQHNRDNAEAALFAVASCLDMPIDELIQQHRDVIIQTFENFQGLPHRLQFLRELNHVKYYDDNFSTTPTSLKVSLEAFPNNNIVLILGGRDKTNNEDLDDIAKIIKDNPQIKQIILIGESGRELVKILNHATFVDTLPKAINEARRKAETFDNAIVLMSPAAASFDMFKNVYDRGAQFQKLIQDLK